MPLTHVKIWKEGDGWEDVSIEEAKRLFWHTVSSSEHIFRCGLCGDWVTLTSGPERERHFRHDSASKTKDCEERSEISGGVSSFSHRLPVPKRKHVKIDVSKLSSKSINLSLGLGGIPIDIRNALSEVSLIVESSQGDKKRFNLDERLSEEGVTYFPSIPIAERYCFSFDPKTQTAKESLERVKTRLRQEYWPESVDVFRKIEPDKGDCLYNSGLFYNIAVFDGMSLKQLSLHDDIILGRQYYVISDKRLEFLRTWGIDCEVLGFFNEDRYCLHKVKCLEFSQETSIVFEKLGLELSCLPALLYPVWPPYVNNKTRISHDWDNTYLFMKGQAFFKVFPYNQWTSDDGRIDSRLGREKNALLKVSSIDREQYFTIGRSGEAIKQFLFWRADVSHLVSETPSVRIISKREEELTESIYYDELPKRLRIKSHFNGFVKVEESGRVVSCKELKADESLPIESPKIGQKIIVYQGLDVIRSISFESAPILDESVSESSQNVLETDENPQDDLFPTIINDEDGNDHDDAFSEEVLEVCDYSKDDFELRKRLERVSGTLIPIPHSFGALSSKMDSYPLVRAWLFKAIRAQSIPQQALKIVVNHFNR